VILASCSASTRLPQSRGTVGKIEVNIFFGCSRTGWGKPQPLKSGNQPYNYPFNMHTTLTTQALLDLEDIGLLTNVTP